MAEAVERLALSLADRLSRGHKPVEHEPSQFIFVVDGERDRQGMSVGRKLGEPLVAGEPHVVLLGRHQDETLTIGILG